MTCLLPTMPKRPVDFWDCQKVVSCTALQNAQSHRAMFKLDAKSLFVFCFWFKNMFTVYFAKRSSFENAQKSVPDMNWNGTFISSYIVLHFE